jgi:hypothetical protein
MRILCNCPPCSSAKAWPVLEPLGIRWRRAYDTRHTCATVALMAGVPPAGMASQLGNSVKMLLDRYAGWIPGGDPGNARAVLVSAMTRHPDGIRPKFVPTGTMSKPRRKAKNPSKSAICLGFLNYRIW